MVSPEARDMAMSAKDPEDAYKYGFRWTATENRGPDLLHDVTITYDKKLDIRENPITLNFVKPLIPKDYHIKETMDGHYLDTTFVALEMIYLVIQHL